MAKEKKVQSEGVKLDMTPMIDVVFQLIIFFVVTLKQEDVLSKLDAMAPAPDPNAKPEEQENLTLITIDIYNPAKNAGEGFLFNKRAVTLKQLDDEIKRAARNNKNSSVLLRCTKDSPHSVLIKALDVCAKHGMTKLAIFSI